ncbi:hypothetical protein CR513_22458, partial [Mucuna pruriens]
MKQSMSSLSSGIKENLERSESEATPKWVTLLQCWFYRQVAVRVTLSLDNFGSTSKSRDQSRLATSDRRTHMEFSLAIGANVSEYAAVFHGASNKYPLYAKNSR